MKCSPNLWTLEVLTKSYADVATNINGKWVPARPMGYDSILHRIRLAFYVFIGRYDALVWPEDQ